jgi:hypothetical protein
MASKNTADKSRFIYRATNKKPEFYFISTDDTRVPIATKRMPSTVPPVHEASSSSPPLVSNRSSIQPVINRTDLSPARRVVVVRNLNNPNVRCGPIDLGNFSKTHRMERSPVLSNGVNLVVLIDLHDEFFAIQNDFVSENLNLSYSTAYCSIGMIA